MTGKEKLWTAVGLVILALVAIKIFLPDTQPTPKAARVAATDPNEALAALINLNGHLCSSIRKVKPLAADGLYEVTCTEYRGGDGTVRYIADLNKGVVARP